MAEKKASAFIHTYTIRAKLWLYDGAPAMKGAWYFVTLPKKQSKEIKERYGHLLGGWGSIRVTATIGPTTWATSIFPDSKRGAYLLPVKAVVRKAEGIGDGDPITLTLEIRT